MNKELKVREIIDRFDLKILSCTKEGLKEGKILSFGFNRAGIELAGYSIHERLNRAVLLGRKENEFIKQMKEEDRNKSFDNLVKKKPVVIILSQSFEDLDIIKHCDKYGVLLLKSENMSSTEIHESIGAYISERLAPSETLHGVALEIFGEGVLIQGESGVGKSEIALELIKRSHTFIGDDAIDVIKIAGRIFAKPNKVTKNFIEVRGLGILNVSRMFGIEKIKYSTNLSLVIKLIKIEDNKKVNFERVGNEQQFITMQKIQIPVYVFPVTSGRNMADLIESAVIDLKLRREGYNSAEEFMKNLNEINKE